MSLQQTLANAELALMELLWEKEPRTARDLREQLYPNPAKAQHGTVQRLLQRLEDKGFLHRDRDQSVHLFSPRTSRNEYMGSQLESLAERLTGGSLAPVLTHLIEEKKLSREDITRLRRVLDEADEGDEA